MRALGAEVSSDVRAGFALLMLAVIGVVCLALTFMKPAEPPEPTICQCFCELPPEAPLP